MQEFREVLVGVDLKWRTDELMPGSRTAFLQGLRLAQGTGAGLTVLHSRWHQGDVWPLSDSGEQVLAELRQEAAGRGVSTRVVTTEERAWLAIMRATVDGRADIVVVGKRDAATTEALRRNGPVPSKLLRKCPVPVWVVTPAHDLDHKLVLVATDLTAVGDRALEFGAYLATESGGRLHVVHAYRIPVDLKLAAAELHHEEYERRVDVLKAEAQAALDERLALLHIEAPASTHLSRKNPAAAIRETVEHLSPDLLIMGSLSRSGRTGVMVGDTAERVLGRVECSLLTLKPTGFVSPVPGS